MTLREEVARTVETKIGCGYGNTEGKHLCDVIADAAIAIVIERAAQEAEKFSRMMDVEPYADTSKLVAKSIRTLAKDTK